MIIQPSRHFEGSDLGLNDVVELDGADVSEILNELVGSVLWLGEHEGFCACPGAHLHTTQDGKRDCKLYLKPVPTISCFHSSCSEVVKATNKKLRSALAYVTIGKKSTSLTPEQKALEAKLRRREALRRRAATARDGILRGVEWSLHEMTASSVTPVPADVSAQWREIMNLFAPDDVVWAGSIYDSGKPEHAQAFRTADDWLKEKECPGQFTCPSTFEPGSCARTNANVVRRPFLVVESDELDKESIAAVFRWIDTKVDVRLRAVVDTAGKSLHGWFDYPADAELDDLKIVLPELGCDPKMFTASQPCRLAGALRDGKYQKLLFLNKEDPK